MPSRRPPKLLRPTPANRPFEVRVRNAQVQSDWDLLVRTRNGPCTRCWDHISTEPRTPVGTLYTRLKGDQRNVVVDGVALEQWQWEADARARIKIGVGRDYVVVVSVSSGHPKDNE